MGVLRVNVGGTWIDVGGGSGSEEVFVGPDDPTGTPSTELWYDTDAIGPTGIAFGDNMIKNPGFLVQQRGTSMTVSGPNVDCWRTDWNGAGWFTDYPALTDYGNTSPGQLGGQKVLRATCTTAKAIAAGDYAQHATRFEGIDLLRLGWGRANPQSLTLSFWVKSNIVGTYVAEIITGSPFTRLVTASYTINAVDTWEYKTVTFPGDTTLVPYDNQLYMQVSWWFAAGSTYSGGLPAPSWIPLDNARRAAGLSVNVGAAINNNFTIANPVLNIGTSAVPWVPRDYSADLTVAQRYFVRYTGPNNSFPAMGSGFANGTVTSGKIALAYPTRMRAIPVVSNVANLRFHTPGTAQAVTGLIVLVNESNDLGCSLQVTTTASTGTTNDPAILQGNGTGIPILDLDAGI